MIFLVKITNRFSSNGTVGQVEQIFKKTILVMMADGFLVEQDISSSWTNKNDILPTYLKVTYLS
jgi:hypothetical protein